MNNGIERELERKAFKDILTHKYFVHGNCINCGKEYAYCTNKHSTKTDLFCSIKCFNENKKKGEQRRKEKHHYRVYKDDKFYYIVVDNIYSEKRNFKGKTWMKRSEQYRQISQDAYKRVSNWNHPIIAESSQIPYTSIKIIDKISPFLYDKKDKFDNWKNKEEIIENE